MYELDVKPQADKVFRKLSNKNPKQLKIIDKKIGEIRQNPFHEYKWMRSPLQNLNRIHIDRHFVLLFRIDHKERTVIIFDYDHHDNIYKNPRNL